MNATAPPYIEIDMNRSALANPGFRRQVVASTPQAQLSGVPPVLAPAAGDFIAAQMTFADGERSSR